MPAMVLNYTFFIEVTSQGDGSSIFGPYEMRIKCQSTGVTLVDYAPQPGEFAFETEQSEFSEPVSYTHLTLPTKA